MTYDRFLQGCQTIRDQLDRLESWAAEHFGQAPPDLDGPWEADGAALPDVDQEEPIRVPAVTTVKAGIGGFGDTAQPFIVSEPPSELEPVTPLARPAPIPRRFRVVHGTAGQKLPNVADQFCVASNPQDAEVLKTMLERQYPGWANILVVRAE